MIDTVEESVGIDMPESVGAQTAPDSVVSITITLDQATGNLTAASSSDNQFLLLGMLEQTKASMIANQALGMMGQQLPSMIRHEMDALVADTVASPGLVLPKSAGRAPANLRALR